MTKDECPMTKEIPSTNRWRIFDRGFRGWRGWGYEVPNSKFQISSSNDTPKRGLQTWDLKLENSSVIGIWSLDIFRTWGLDRMDAVDGDVKGFVGMGMKFE